MHWVQALIIFMVSWWIVFLPSLSIGVQGQYESDEEMADGVDSGAPIAPMLLKKAVWATIGAMIITVLAAIFIPMLAPS